MSEHPDHAPRDARPEEPAPAAGRELRRYRELFDLAPVAYLITDGESAIEEANLAAVRLLGVEPDALPGTRIADSVPAGERERFRELLAALRRGGAGGELELWLDSPRGGFVAAITVERMAGGEGGHALRWVIVDVTERRLAEDESRRLAAELEQRVQERTAELRAERELLATVIEQVPAGLTLIDEPTGRLVSANAQAWEIARARFGAGADLEPILARARVAGAESASVVPAGSGAIEVTVAPIHDQDGVVRLRVALFQDVTARERLEQAEREFVTNAAHELQTPLTAITSAAEVLQSGAKESPADRDRFLTHIQQECDRLARLVRALLVLARTQISGEPAAGEPVVLRPLLEGIRSLLRPRAGVRVEVDCPPRLAALANRELLEHAVWSLGGNAVKYTSEGLIVLRGVRAGGDRVALEVADTGPGIDAAEQALVRQRFYRGGDTRDRSGFGLGLAIAEQAARALGGTLELDSAPGEGTTLRLLLPASASRPSGR